MPIHLQESSAGKDDANAIRRQNADQITNESNSILEKHDDNAREAQNDRLHQQLTFPLKPLSEQVGGGIEKQRKRHQLLRAEAEDRDCAQENIQAARQHLKLQITANVVCNGLRNASTKEAIAQRSKGQEESLCKGHAVDHGLCPLFAVLHHLVDERSFAVCQEAEEGNAKGRWHPCCFQSRLVCRNLVQGGQLHTSDHEP
mmetsp:Transcript_21363/g.50836  ORF Transcript_21363/g.50836 Transcript_21363/m.50836 type:complete len:201 (+) Transcript_21363:301-903(+)